MDRLKPDRFKVTYTDDRGKQHKLMNVPGDDIMPPERSSTSRWRSEPSYGSVYTSSKGDEYGKSKVVRNRRKSIYVIDSNLVLSQRQQDNERKRHKHYI